MVLLKEQRFTPGNEWLSNLMPPEATVTFMRKAACMMCGELCGGRQRYFLQCILNAQGHGPFTDKFSMWYVSSSVWSGGKSLESRSCQHSKPLKSVLCAFANDKNSPSAKRHLYSQASFLGMLQDGVYQIQHGCKALLSKEILNQDSPYAISVVFRGMELNQGHSDNSFESGALVDRFFCHLLYEGTLDF